MVVKLTRSLCRLNSTAHPAVPMISVHFFRIQQNFQGLIWLTWENCPSVSQLLQFGVVWGVCVCVCVCVCWRWWWNRWIAGYSSGHRVSLVAQTVKNLLAMQETWVWSLGWEDSPGEGKGYPLQYSDLENSMDCIVHGVTKSRTRLSDFHFPVVIMAGWGQLHLDNMECVSHEN